VEQGVIRVKASLSGISRAPLVRFDLIVKIYADGEIRFQLDGNVRPDAIWLPRFGYEFTLPGDYRHFSYFGNGPFESYRDMRHAGMVGLHCSNVDAEYVPYVRPQEHGNHTDSRWLRIGKLEFAAEDQFEINVSQYGTDTLTAANHTDELVADGNTHVRIDYKVSGLGSNSCGPSLEKQYRLDEKEISFRFFIRPLRG
jgi:beta-galactosidase